MRITRDVSGTHYTKRRLRWPLIPEVELVVDSTHATRRWTWWLGVTTVSSRGLSVPMSELRSIFLECHVTSSGGDRSDNTTWQIILRGDPDLELWRYPSKASARTDAEHLSEACSLKIDARY